MGLCGGKCVLEPAAADAKGLGWMTEHDPHWARRAAGFSRYPVMTFQQNEQADSQSQALLLRLLRRTSHIVAKVDVLVDTVREQCELG